MKTPSRKDRFYAWLFENALGLPFEIAFVIAVGVIAWLVWGRGR